MSERYYDPEWWQATLSKGIPLSFRMSELPLEELLILNEYSMLYPGLMWNLRKQRGRRGYLLTILPARGHLEDNNVRGEP